MKIKLRSKSKNYCIVLKPAMYRNSMTGADAIKGMSLRFNNHEFEFDEDDVITFSSGPQKIIDILQTHPGRGQDFWFDNEDAFNKVKIGDQKHIITEFENGGFTKAINKTDRTQDTISLAKEMATEIAKDMVKESAKTIAKEMIQTLLDNGTISINNPQSNTEEVEGNTVISSDQQIDEDKAQAFKERMAEGKAKAAAAKKAGAK